MLRKRMTTLPFLPLALSPYVIFDTDYALISCPLCKSNALKNILMILVVMKNRTRRHVTNKNDNFGFFYFWSYLPFLCLNLISCLRSAKRIPFGIF